MDCRLTRPTHRTVSANRSGNRQPPGMQHYPKCGTSLAVCASCYRITAHIPHECVFPGPSDIQTLQCVRIVSERAAFDLSYGGCPVA